jgi:hypothetical protein
MTKLTLVILTAVVLIAAGIGIWETSPHVAAKPEIVPTGDPSIARMFPMEIMKERGKDLQSGKTEDPF